MLFCCLSAATMAQEHMTFKNIPIEGNINDFVEKMEAQNFSVEEKLDGVITMKGSFAGFDDCRIYLIFSKKSQTVWKVTVSLPEQVSWTSTKSRYEDYKEKYTQKYGRPTKSYEFFLSPYERGDGYELQAISLEKGYYSTYWKSNLGTIVVEIEATSNSKGWVRLLYEDAAGVEIMKAEKNAAIEDDI